MSTDPPAHLTWVICAGVLLGSALVQALGAGRRGSVQTSSISWNSGLANDELAAGLDHFVAAVRARRVPWRIAWCAGAGVTGTTDAVLDAEVETVTAFFRLLARRADLPPGTVFLASSAGGVYAGGGKSVPYGELDPPAAVSAYGRAKLAGELAATNLARTGGHAIWIGRIANLYGPGQNLSKGQGLISQLCRANLSRAPTSVYVPLDTMRDYLFVGDCAAMISDLL
ncbi:MAG: NAD-dependent epimerase/dehydratase family protein, partial [Nakamurella sp.]